MNIRTIDPKLFITQMKEERRKRCRDQEWKNFKLGLSLHVEFFKETPDGVVRKIDAWFNGGCMKAVTHISLLDDVVLKMIGEMNECISKFTCQRSGWIISKLLEF
jgi:hypothetical protein